MGSTFFYSPVLHGKSDCIRDGNIKFLAVLYSLMQRLVGLFCESLLHHGIIEYHAAKYLGNIYHNFKPLLQKR